ncbi:BQ5605_C013g07361 [Microbotryum silenes-dioicae]|uniref:BQ5605_C013g07361 protein n=1 Tax=Microbotryum silenes-dioicae TaxID=796604 RepID=A0A2X0LVS4_9BASI|nr:BQ5605_C013g07361 [Microbotryum silenes-dioicae]
MTRLDQHRLVLGVGRPVIETWLENAGVNDDELTRLAAVVL